MSSLPRLVGLAVLLLVPGVLAQEKESKKALPQPQGEKFDRSAREHAHRMLTEGKETFRFDTFGSEDFWGGKLKLHDAIQGKKHGGA